MHGVTANQNNINTPPCKALNLISECSTRSALIDLASYTCTIRSCTRCCKPINDLTFLKKCRDANVVPKGLCLRDPIQNSNSARIIHTAGKALLRKQIASTRYCLSCTDQEISRNRASLRKTMLTIDYDKISALTDKSIYIHVHVPWIHQKEANPKIPLPHSLPQMSNKRNNKGRENPLLKTIQNGKYFQPYFKKYVILSGITQNKTSIIFL